MKIEPVRIAKVRVVGGKVLLDGGWVDVAPFHSRADEICLWECYGRRWGVGSSAMPDDAGGSPCGLGSSRWYFGDGYLNPYSEDDVTAAHDGQLTSLAAAFYWCPIGGSGDFLHFTFWNSTSDLDTCMPGGLGDLGGIVLDFGRIYVQCAGYTYFEADLSVLGVVFPARRLKSHSIALASAYDPDTGDITLLGENCQMMLWAAPEDTYGTEFPGAVGDQGANALDDDAPTDGNHDPVAECYSYLFGICPDPLGKMMAYGGTRSCIADFNTDGVVTGDDFDLFVAAFARGDVACEINGDGFVNGEDFDVFVLAFEAGC